MILMIDNYDSFTYNLVQYFKELDAVTIVFRHDEISIPEVIQLAPTGIVISPGPCTPNEAGISISLVRECAGKIPIFGVCLGHQTIGQALGGQVIRARQVMHGKISTIYHNNRGVFAGLPSPYEATRYHSLVVDKHSLPDCFEITAWTQTQDGQIDEIMGMRHKSWLLEGVQFHPEAILTQHGKTLLNNFLAQCKI